MKKYLTKRQKAYRIRKTGVKFTDKQLKKLYRLKRADSFVRALKRAVGSIRGGKTTKMLYSKSAKKILLRRERRIIKQLKKNPEDKQLKIELLKNTIRLNRLYEKNPNLTPQERESMIYKHRIKEEEMRARISHGEKLKQSKHGYNKADFVDTYFSSQYQQGRDDLQSQMEELVDKANKLEEQNKDASELYDQIKELSDKLDGGKEEFFNEEILPDLEEARQHNGNGVYREDNFEEIIYDS